MTIDSTLARLRAFAKANGWKKSRFAKEAGLTDTVLRDFDRPEWNPTTATIKRLEAIIPKNWQPPKRGKAA